MAGEGAQQAGAGGHAEHDAELRGPGHALLGAGKAGRAIAVEPREGQDGKEDGADEKDDAADAQEMAAMVPDPARRKNRRRG